MSSPKVFESPVGGTVPLPHHVEDEATSPSKKRPADILESLTPVQKKARSDALVRERKRYEDLRKDALCHVSPTCGQYVQCDRCGARIKLSNKNNFDAQHWKKHRSKCVKRPAAVVADLRAASSLGQRKMSCTPELTADSASERTGTSASVSVKSEPSSSRAPSPIPSTTPWLDARRRDESALLTGHIRASEYMAIAHPDIAPARVSTSYAELLEKMQAWTPTQVKPPVCFGSIEVDRAELGLRTPAQWPVAEAEAPDDEEVEALRLALSQSTSFAHSSLAH